MTIVIDRFLSIADVNRAQQALRKLAQHDISRWALTGRFAIEYHCSRHGLETRERELNDIDFVASDFEHIPATLASDYLFRHVHPFDPPAKTLVQFVDVDCALRLDVFRTTAGVMRRAEVAGLGFGRIAIVALEDMAARSARLAMSLSEGKPVAPKHVTDYRRLVEIADPLKMERAWQDHRRTFDPESFEETRVLLRHLIPARSDLQVPVIYSRDMTAICPRCHPAPPFQMAEAGAVLSVLGYC